MKRLIFFLFFAPLALLQAQTCADCRFISPVFDSVSVQTVKFGEGINADGQNQELFMDFYQPVGDTAATRPVVIFAFGGGFIQGARDESYVISACERFARAGYVSAAIDYRIGIDWLQFLDPIAEMQRVFMRAMQDMRGSVQYMRYHADSLNNTWRLDTNHIFIGGASAGAITALMVEHCDKDVEYTEIGPLSSLNSLGGFYESSSPHKSYSWDSEGTINIVGALVKADWIEPGDSPILSVHGDEDGTVPYEGGNLNLGFAQIGLEGSYLVDKAADSAGGCSYLYTIVGGDHPSGSMSDEDMDAIFNRLLPRLEALVHDRTYCCNLGISIDPTGPIQVSPGDQIPLTSVVSGNQGNATFQWCGDPCIPSSPNQQITVQPLPGHHVYAIVREGNCQEADFISFVNVVGIEEPFGGTITAYPNPTSGTLKVDWQSPQNAPETLQLMDVTGRMLAEYYPAGTAFLELSVTDLKPGYYLLIAEQNGHRSTLKFIRN